jgi:hypothetical protein
MRKIITVLFLAIGLISCSSEGQASSSSTILYGKWNWISTDGGIGFHIHSTPASTGNSIQLNLLKDNTFSITKNGKEVSSGKFELSTQKSIFTGEVEKFIICHETTENKEPLNIVTEGIIKASAANKLTIDNNFPDGIGSGFERIK